ncbi:fimbrial biogenesis chaperone [Zestomonas carbonaria]|uniref:Chaperone protein EcpD n=1 Tax=Zestomonas carbonaria TaxID=2762745 RepID=A0A7U7ETQ3_9GAMM|nr:fimbria/pilus periplasmic chaperone [Pseudomonas carbonaria]CAD5110465.1 hypothetical protein PSEWESI4_04788 [Pseudomonas carbonaria]
MTCRNALRRLLWGGMALLACEQALAGVVISGTRVIYPADKKEVNVRLNNNGAQPALVQAWIDSGDAEASPTQSTAPFLLSPPVFRLDPGKGQTLRLMFNGAPLPGDRESVFWLNALEIPPRPKAQENLNVLHMAFRSRIKLFYRPARLPGSPDKAPEGLAWKLVSLELGKGYALWANNPSAYHVSLVGVALVDGERRHASEDGMVAPRKTHLFPLPELRQAPGADARVEFDAINDYGALRRMSVPLGVAIDSAPHPNPLPRGEGAEQRGGTVQSPMVRTDAPLSLRSGARSQGPG